MKARLVVLALVGLVALAVVGVRPGAASAGADGEGPAAAVGLAGDQAAGDSTADALALAQKFVPVYYLRQQSSICDRGGEAFEPMSVQLILAGQQEIRLRGGGPGTEVAGPTLADLAGKGAEFYVDLPGDPTNPGCTYNRDFARYARGIPAAVYAHVAREPGKPGFALQFWTYWYFNDWNNTHEGDWEMTELVFAEKSVRAALNSAPILVGYAQHGSGEKAEWDDRKLKKEDGHPVVYPSAGSHASYYRPHTYVGLGESGSGFGCDRADGPHRRVAPEVILLEAGGDGDSQLLSYLGSWGQLARGEFSGPTGPADKRAWREPITWADGLRDGSTVLPGDTLFGNNAIGAFCSTVEAASNLLRDFMRFPFLVGGAAILVLGFVSVGGLVVLREASRDPLVGPELAGFIGKRRTLGQAARAAATVYRRRALLFLGIAVAFIPLNAGLGAAHSLLSHVPPFSALLWMVDGSQAGGLLVSLLIGGAVSVPVYLFVLAGALAAARALDEGRAASVGGAYRQAFLRGLPLLGGRIIAFMTTAMLSLTVVGLPFAARAAVRWAFLEEAVMLDGRGLRDGLGASISVTRGQWWRAARVVLFFSISGTIAGPLLGFILLFQTDLSVGMVNVIAGVVGAAILPLTALGLALSYRDLQIRKLERPEPPPGPLERFDRAIVELGIRGWRKVGHGFRRVRTKSKSVRVESGGAEARAEASNESGSIPRGA